MDARAKSPDSMSTPVAVWTWPFHVLYSAPASGPLRAMRNQKCDSQRVAGSVVTGGPEIDRESPRTNGAVLPKPTPLMVTSERPGSAAVFGL